MTECLIHDTRLWVSRCQNAKAHLGRVRGEGSRFEFTIKGSILTAAWLLAPEDTWRRPQRYFLRGRSHSLHGTLSRYMHEIFRYTNRSDPIKQAIPANLKLDTYPDQDNRFTTPERWESMQRISPPELVGLVG